MEIIDSIASFYADLLGCEEGDTVCQAKSRKYATWTVLIVIILAIIIIVPKIYWIIKKR